MPGGWRELRETKSYEAKLLTDYVGQKPPLCKIQDDSQDRQMEDETIKWHWYIDHEASQKLRYVQHVQLASTYASTIVVFYRYRC